jgi:hypothetical protein
LLRLDTSPLPGLYTPIIADGDSLNQRGTEC